MNASTYGTGLMVKKCLNKGIKHFKIFFGGSATYDGGCGISKALGNDLLN